MRRHVPQTTSPSKFSRNRLTRTVISARSGMHFGLIVVAVWVLLTALWYILPTARADVYDLLLARTTEKWCAATLASGTPRRMARRKWHTAHDRVVACHATALLPLQVRRGARSLGA